MKFLKAAHRLAEKSEHPVYPMAAIVFRGGSVLSQATNGKATGRHAEIRALSADIDFYKASLIVVRNNGDNTSRPCRTCFLLAKSLGVHKLYFYDSGTLINTDTRYSDERYYRDYGF